MLTSCFSSVLSHLRHYEIETPKNGITNKALISTEVSLTASTMIMTYPITTEPPLIPLFSPRYFPGDLDQFLYFRDVNHTYVIRASTPARGSLSRHSTLPTNRARSSNLYCASNKDKTFRGSTILPFAFV
jgi:hypothetical protein